MPTGRPDYHIMGDIDIIAQTFENLKNKEFWDAYTVTGISGTLTTSGIGTILDSDFKGQIVGGEITITTPESSFSTSRIIANIDGALVESYELTELINHYPVGAQNLLSLAYNSITTLKMLYTFTNKFYVQNNLTIKLDNQTGGNIVMTGAVFLGKDV